MNPVENIYDPAIARTLLGGAAAAYGDSGDMRAWAMARGCSRWQAVQDSATDTLCLVAGNASEMFVIFRGTRDLRNWLTDLEVARVPWMPDGANASNGKNGTDELEVHEGFWNALEGVWDEIAFVLSTLPAGQNIFFAGHSLGGALAMLAAARWTTRPRDHGTTGPVVSSPVVSSPVVRGPGQRAWLYTFGQPRVGNAAWAAWYDGRLRSRSFRVVHAGDIVARIPWLLWAYRHAGIEVFYSGGAAKPSFRIDPPWWSKAWSDLFGSWAELVRSGRIAPLGDHPVGTYMEMLDADCGMRNAENTQPDGGIPAAATTPNEHGI